MSTKMQYIFTGFSQEAEYRKFRFEKVAADRSRTEVTVRADLDLVRRYGIRVQELPLLCRRLLEREDGVEEAAVTFGEAEMCRYASDCAAARAAAAAHRKAFPRKPVSEKVGAGWRATRPE